MIQKLLSLALLLTVTSAAAEDNSLLPRYGGIAKTADQKEADKVFIKEVLKASGTKEAAGKDLVAKGFNALLSGDAPQAMRRFNQAWLLTPENPEVTWGLGDASAALGKFNESYKLLEEARTKIPTNVNLLNDIGYAHLQEAVKAAKSEKEAMKDFDDATNSFAKAAKADDKDDRAFFNMAMIAFYKGDYKTAWAKVSDAEARGGKSVDPRFLTDLGAKMPRP